IQQEEAPKGAALCDPAGSKQKKIRGHLSGIGINEQCHADGYEKLAKLALHMSSVGIPIYGMRDHVGKIQILCTVPNDRNEHVIGHVYLDFVEENGYVIPLQMTVDGGNETGIMYGFQHSLHFAYPPDLDESQYPTFVSLQSTDNIPVESMWSYWQKAKGTTICQVIASGYEQGFFIHQQNNLFQWLWPKIVQQHLDDF
ncbi:hypothetical protein GYMLUDRAFT_176144, partial [Collybiopsis luxurians FD-317 M1]